jgi:hypothetical protein
MLIEIDDTKTIADIQERFSLCFPYLKLEFYRKPHHWEGSSPARHLIDPAIRVGDIRKAHNPEILEIKSWDKTGEVEQMFKRILGLHPQIFRLENNEWKQSKASDNLTLARQTEIAMNTKRDYRG